MNNRALVTLMANCYQNEKCRLEEAENNPDCVNDSLMNSQIICNTIEENAQYLSEDDRFIIDNEVIKGKKGKWYIGYLSESTYYRHSKRAYIKFLKLFAL